MFPWLQGTKDSGTVLVSLTNLNKGDVAMAMISAGHAHPSADEDITDPVGDESQYPLRPETPTNEFLLRVTHIENDIVYGQLLNEGER